MSVTKKMGGAGLRGQSAGETSICTVGVSGMTVGVQMGRQGFGLPRQKF